MLSAAKTPSQQAMIYNQYGKYEMAAEVEAEGNKVEDQNTTVKNYWSESLGSSYKDVVIAGKSALSNIDLSHPNYSSIAERTDEAYRESLNPYQDMMKDPLYEYEAKLLLAKGKMPNADIQGIFDQFDSMKARYIKGRYGESGDEGGEGKTLEEQESELVSPFVTDAFTPKGALSFLPESEIQEAKAKVEPLKKQHDVLSSQLTSLKSQRQSVYDNYEAKKKDLSVAIKQVKYYAKIKDKAKLKKANDSYQKLNSEIGSLKREVSKLKLGEHTGGTPSKSDKSLGAQISRINLEINSLKRQSRRLSGQPVYGGGYYDR